MERKMRAWLLLLAVKSVCVTGVAEERGPSDIAGEWDELFKPAEVDELSSFIKESAPWKHPLTSHALGQGKFMKGVLGLA